MYDLFYVNDDQDYDEVRELLLSRFPDASIGDASDYLHPHRFHFQADVPEEGYRLAVMELGLFNLSFDMQMLARTEPDEVRRLIEMVKAQEAKPE